MITKDDIRIDYQRLGKPLDIEILNKTFYHEEYVKYLEESFIRHIGYKFFKNKDGIIEEIKI